MTSAEQLTSTMMTFTQNTLCLFKWGGYEFQRPLPLYWKLNLKIFVQPRSIITVVHRILYIGCGNIRLYNRVGCLSSKTLGADN